MKYFLIVIGFLFFLIWYYYFNIPIERVIYYTYEDVTVTRIDKGGKISLYYGHCNLTNGDCPEPSIVINWRDDFALNGYLLFHKNKLVEVFNGGGGYYQAQKEGSKNIFMKEYENPELSTLLDPYLQNRNYRNLVQIYNPPHVERMLNLKNNSQVKVEYIELINTEKQ